LATLYGQPNMSDRELLIRNRVAWNRCMASNLGDETRDRLINERYPAEELKPFSEEERQGIETALLSRRLQAVPRIADLITNDIDFSNTEMGDLEFAGRIFRPRTSFRGATFPHGANFRDTTFCGGANFRDTTFSDDANFRRTTFSGNADFRGTTFSGEANFDGARLSRTDFRGKADSDAADADAVGLDVLTLHTGLRHGRCQPWFGSCAGCTTRRRSISPRVSSWFVRT
jgi:Pentapeptide repeats (9 copies)